MMRCCRRDDGHDGALPHGCVQVYTGEVGKELGLVDHVGELRTELQARYGRFVRLETVEEDIKPELSRLLRWLL